CQKPMIGALKKLFSEDSTEQERTTDETKRLAAAALLIEVARADFQQDASEEASMAALLASTLKLSEAQVGELLSEAGEAVDQATSLYEFTRAVNDYYNREDKIELMTSLWQVAYADQSLDKYEEHIIRRIADLIYVSHEDFIRCKLKVRNALDV
ncbi:MAG: TerB family tellurite resistance protein, partial [Pseudomonadota bacterium]